MPFLYTLHDLALGKLLWLGEQEPVFIEFAIAMHCCRNIMPSTIGYDDDAGCNVCEWLRLTRSISAITSIDKWSVFFRHLQAWALTIPLWHLTLLKFHVDFDEPTLINRDREMRSPSPFISRTLIKVVNKTTNTPLSFAKRGVTSKKLPRDIFGMAASEWSSCDLTSLKSPTSGLDWLLIVTAPQTQFRIHLTFLQRSRLRSFLSRPGLHLVNTAVLTGCRIYKWIG